MVPNPCHYAEEAPSESARAAPREHLSRFTLRAHRPGTTRVRAAPYRRI